MRAVPLANSQPVRAYLTMICIRLDSHGRSLVARDGFAVPPMGLTNREIERLRLVASGHADKEIAQGRGVEPSTAHEVVKKAKRRLQATFRAELTAIAVAWASWTASAQGRQFFLQPPKWRVVVPRNQR